MPSKVWDEITYLIPNVNRCIVEVWEGISNFIPSYTYNGCTYLFMLGLELSHVNNDEGWVYDSANYHIEVETNILPVVVHIALLGQ